MRVGYDENYEDSAGRTFDYSIEEAHTIGTLGWNPDVARNVSD